MSAMETTITWSRVIKLGESEELARHKKIRGNSSSVTRDAVPLRSQYGRVQ
jgi:hypothetical protein